jgi:hypothetical protein
MIDIRMELYTEFSMFTNTMQNNHFVLFQMQMYYMACSIFLGKTISQCQLQNQQKIEQNDLPQDANNHFPKTK